MLPLDVGDGAAQAARGVGAVPAGAPPVFFRSVREFLHVLPAAAQRFWFLVIAVGVVSGLGSGALLAILGGVQRLAWPAGEQRFIEAVTEASPLRRVIVPALAGAVVGLLSLVWRRPLGGHGTARIIEAIWARGRGMQLGPTLLRGLVSIGAVGMGASLGREGALLQTGAAAGSWLAQRLKVTDQQARVIVACGAASGIAAAYDVPIGGALFGLEVLLGSFALELLGPIVVSCVAATAVARTLPVPHPSYVVPVVQVLKPGALLVGLLVAPLLGLASVIFIRVLGRVEVEFERLPRWTAPLLPVLGMAALGAAAIAFPRVLGNGFDTAQDLLRGEVPLALLIVLPALKLAATALCAGTGVPGGLFTPSLVYGAALGALAGAALERVAPGLAPPPGAIALVGMAGVLAGTTHATVSSVLILFEMTGDYGVILPLMLSAAVSSLVSRAIEPDSLYTAPLRRRGAVLPSLPRPEWLRETPVSSLVVPVAHPTSPGTPFDVVVRRLLSLPSGHDLYVTDRAGQLLGVIRLDALKGTISDQDDLRMIVAADVMDREIAPVTMRMHVADVAARFAETELERLPVVDSGRRLVGTVGMRDVLAKGKF
jgi:CIC family chloride channel protein